MYRSEACVVRTNDQTRSAVQKERDDAWLDEVLSQTFPASDPVPSGHGETRAPDVDEGHEHIA
jgi:hypothetical protein